jgi:hypothetical protein
MYQALSGGLMLAVMIVVLKSFVPEVAVGLIELITKVIGLAINIVDHAATGLPS